MNFSSEYWTFRSNYWTFRSNYHISEHLPSTECGCFPFHSGF